MQVLRREIEWINKAGAFNQVYTTGLEYAFCNLDFKQLMPWVLCKDFLHDTIFTYLNKSQFNLFGYNYAPSKEEILNLRRMRLLVTNKSDLELSLKIENSVDLVNQLEKEMGVPSLSRVFSCPKPPKRYEKCGVFMFSGSGHWLLSPPLISLYTLMVRVGFSHSSGKDFRETIDKIISGEIKPYQSGVGTHGDQFQLKDAKPGIDRLIKEGYQKIFGSDMRANFPPGLPESEMHDYFGIGSFTKELSKPYVPHWFETKVEV